MPLKYVFYAEVLINIPSFVLCFFFPDVFAGQLGSPDNSDFSLDLVRWYGVILFVLTYILARALYSKDLNALKMILSGYAIGDILQIIVTHKMSMDVGGWNFSLAFTAILSILLFTARVAALNKPSRLGFA